MVIFLVGLIFDSEVSAQFKVTFYAGYIHAVS